MDQLESMRVLLAVVDAGSLSGAGRRLGMPLATVSRKLSLLEAHLKAQLLIRSTRQLKLTESGRAYVAACSRILEDVQEAERIVAGEYHAPRGEVVVTAPVVFGRLHLLPVICEFLRIYPEVNVRLQFGDRVVNLLEDSVDLALRVGALPDSGLNATSLGRLQRVVCASPAYLAVHGSPRRPSDLVDHQCISFESLTSADTWHFLVDGKDVAVPVRSRLVVTAAEGAIDAAVAGVGVCCVLSYQVEAALRDKQLEVILRQFEPPPFPVSLVYSGQGRLPLKLRALLDYAAPRLRVRLTNVEAALNAAALTARPRKQRMKRAKRRSLSR